MENQEMATHRVRKEIDAIIKDLESFVKEAQRKAVEKAFESTKLDDTYRFQSESDPEYFKGVNDERQLCVNYQKNIQTKYLEDLK